MNQSHLFPLVRQKLLESLNGYVQHPILINKINEYIVPPALGNKSGMLGAIALAKNVVSDKTG
jgi:fructokinase